MARALHSIPALPRRSALAVCDELQFERAKARAWAEQIDDRRRQGAAWAFIAATIRGYLEARGQKLGHALQVSPLNLAIPYSLDVCALHLAKSLGNAASNLAPLQACYQISSTYTAMLPSQLRSEWGAYYTPPALTDRLLDMAEEAGVDWATARVLDPACGGGAFLLPVAMRMRAAQADLSADAFLSHLTTHLRGFEIDPFAAWLTQVWLEATFATETFGTNRCFPPIVSVLNSLDQLPRAGEGFNLVVGNPPYGRVSLTPAQRSRFRRSLFGHANLYGVFTDLALRWTRKGGVVAYVTPTSFLSGEYFKALRSVIAREAAPIAIDFVSARRGVFEDVLQEAALSTYRRGRRSRQAVVHHLSVDSSESFRIVHAGRVKLPVQATDPWLAPREPSHQQIADQAALMPTRLADWGYTVSTGPLVWNRFKSQLCADEGRDRFPLIWAEAVTADGRFVFRADKRGHQPYFRTTVADDWLKVTTPCVLVQRTTAKEQSRRLIAAELPAAFVEKHKAVIIENHLNMIRPLAGSPHVSPAAVAAVFNSRGADMLFRCISGSVAVSAFELEALPLPNVEDMRRVDALIRRRACRAEVDSLINSLFGIE